MADSLNKFEDIIEFSEESLGLKAFLVKHSSGEEGISIGGCRLKKYHSKEEALEDAKRLATNMTLKYKVVGLPYGGLKLVIYQMDNSRRKESFNQIGKWVNSFEGKCYVATDVGTSLEDMIDIYSETPYVLDLPKSRGGFGTFVPLLTGGVINGLTAAVEFRYGKPKMNGLSAYVLGFGNSGMSIARRLLEEGCVVTGNDLDKNKNKEAKNFGIVINPNFISKEYDLFVPCASGTVFLGNETPKVGIIGGSANNPLKTYQEENLHHKGILTLPDFVISSGAIVIDDLIIKAKDVNLEIGIERTKRIYNFSKEILQRSKKTSNSPREEALGLLGY